MSQRERLITRIEFLPEKSIEKVMALVSSEIEANEEPIFISDDMKMVVDTKLKRGMEDIEAGKIIPAKEVRERMQRRYGS